MSLKTPMAVFAASERKHNAAAGRDIQVAWGVIHEWRKSERRDWYADW